MLLTILSWLLTVVMVFVCIALVGLVLIQLPKKEAGAGLAFGGGATDALFGAGSGNVLTKITKWFAGGFFVLAIVLSMLQSAAYHRSSTFLNQLSQPAKSTATTAGATPPAQPATPAAVPAVGTNAPTTGGSMLLSSGAGSTNKVAVPAPTATNKPAPVQVEATNAPARPAAGAAK